MTRDPMEESRGVCPARFTTPPPKGCDMTDDKKNKMVNEGDKEAKNFDDEQLKNVAAGPGKRGRGLREIKSEMTRGGSHDSGDEWSR